MTTNRIFLTAVCCVSFTVHMEAGWSIPLKLAKELVEELAEALGKSGLRKLGGRQAAQGILARAYKEGGEQLARKVVAVGRQHGAQVLSAISKSPRLFVSAVEKLPAHHAKEVLHAIRRQPELMEKLLRSYGDDVAKLTARHSGFGPSLASKLGREGIETALKLSSSNATRLNAFADVITRVKMPDRKRLLDKIGRGAKVVLDYLEKHPHILYTTAGVVTVLALKEELFLSTEEETVAPDGSTTVTRRTGLLAWTSQKTYEFLSPVAQVAAVLVAIWLALKLAMSLWHQRRLHRMEQDSAFARHARESQHRGEKRNG